MNYWQNLESKNFEKIFSAHIQKWNFKKQKFKIYFINFLGRKCEKISSNLTINASVLDVFDYYRIIFFHLRSLTIFDISSDIYYDFCYSSRLSCFVYNQTLLSFFHSSSFLFFVRKWYIWLFFHCYCVLGWV